MARTAKRAAARTRGPKAARRESRRTPSSSTKAKRKPDPAQAVGELPLFFQFQRIGGNLTPGVVSTILAEADIGSPQRLVDLYHELRQKPGPLHQAMQTRELALAGLDWACEAPDELPGGKRKRNKAAKIAEDCAKMVRKLENLPELWAHLVGEGTAFGHAHSQIMWERDGTRLYPARFKNVASRRFIFRIEDGALLFSDAGFGAGAANDGLDLCEEYPAKFIQYRPRVNGDVPVREGLARLLVWAGLFGNWTLKDWLLLGEIAWKPWVQAIYQKGAGPEDIAALEVALQRMSSTGRSMLPETTKLVVEWPKSSGTASTSAHRELWETLVAEVTKAILGQTLTSDQGQRGSQSLGKVHNEIRKDILEADAKGIARAFTEYVLRPYVEANWGGGAPVPVFRFLTEDTTDTLQLSEALKNLREGGMSSIPESWVRDEFGIPEPQGDEPCLTAAPKAPPNGTDPTAPKPDAPKPGADPPDADDDAEEPAEAA